MTDPIDLTDEQNENVIHEALARAGTLPRAALEALFMRYGMPLEDPTATLDPVITVEGVEVGRLSYRSPVDVIANDHFVLREGEHTLAMPGPLFAAAVAALTRKQRPEEA